MRLAILSLAAALVSTLDDLVNQASSHIENLADQLGPDVDVDLEAGTITLPLSTFQAILQPEDFAVPAPPEGHTWEVLSVEAPAPVGAVAFVLGAGPVIARPSSPSVLYLVPTVAGGA
jgi:hypothetical protein